MFRSIIRRGLVFLLATSLPLAPALAAYPERPIRIVVPTTPGGGADTLARVLGAELAKRLGQSVSIENLPGANGMIGMGRVAKANPDGYSLALTFTDHFINPSLYRNQPYDLLADFTPVSYLGQLPFVLAINRDVPARSVAELIALARRDPGALNFASAGKGGALHMAGELFKQMANAPITHVPYKGTSAALPDLMSGRVQLIFTSAISAKTYADAGKLRLLASTGAQRGVDVPDLPTVAEAGVPNYVAGIWYGVLAPAKTPGPVIDLLNREITAVLKSPEFSSSMAKQGITLAPGTPESFGQFYRTEIIKWSRVLNDAGIKLGD